MYVSLDGVVEDPAWTGPFWNEQLSMLQADYLFASEALLLGRVTYEGFAAAWPAMEETTGEFGKRMNSMPKVVVSTTLTDPAWKNTTVISGDVPAAVARLKDEYHLMVHPIVLGSGKRLFKEGAAGTELALTDCRKVGPDVLLLIYRPASRP